MNEGSRFYSVNDFKKLAVPEILLESQSFKDDYDKEGFDVSMVAVFNRFATPHETLDYQDEMDAAFAKTMLKVTAIQILELLDDFDATPIINMMEQIKHEND